MDATKSARVRGVIHVGPGKTGTTALQRALSENRAPLRTRGILYPRGCNPLDLQTHHSLALRILDEDHHEVWNLHHYGRNALDIRRLGNRYWAAIVREVKAARPDTLVLSSEVFSRASRDVEWRRLAALVGTVAGEIEVAFYVRDPAEYWLSRLQQSARWRREPLPLYRASVRDRIEQIHRAFGVMPKVRAFSPGLLHGGEIVSDFAATFLGVDAGDLPFAPRRENASLTAESLSILMEFQRWRSGPSTDSVAVGRLVQDLQTVEASMPAAHPIRLKPEVREQIISAARDLPWLQQQFGIEFPGIDYSQSFAESLPDTPISQIEDVVHVDPARRAELMSRLVAASLHTRKWGRVARDAATALTPDLMLGGPEGAANAYDRLWLRFLAWRHRGRAWSLR